MMRTVTSELSARSTMLYRIMLGEADHHGIVDFGRSLELTRTLVGYGPDDTAALQTAGLLEPFEGGWLVPLKELLVR
jgi:hypothetical protein